MALATAGPGAVIDYDKSDAWSSGMMFYRVLARGAAPFPGEDPRAFADEDYRELPAAGVGSGLRRIVRGLLRVDPAARLSAATALGELWAWVPPICAAADGAATCSRALVREAEHEATDLRVQLAAALRGEQRAVQPSAPPLAQREAIERARERRAVRQPAQQLAQQQDARGVRAQLAVTVVLLLAIVFGAACQLGMGAKVGLVHAPPPPPRDGGEDAQTSH